MTSRVKSRKDHAWRNIDYFHHHSNSNVENYTFSFTFLTKSLLEAQVGKCVIYNIRVRVMMKIIDIASCMIFPALYSTSQVCSVIFSSVAPRTKLYAPYNSYPPQKVRLDLLTIGCPVDSHTIRLLINTVDDTHSNTVGGCCSHANTRNSPNYLETTQE